MTNTTQPTKTVIAFGAHPDDHLGCAGFLMQLKAKGYTVHEVVATAGEAGAWQKECGTLHVDHCPEALKQHRLDEMQQACEIIGTDELTERFLRGLKQNNRWNILGVVGVDAPLPKSIMGFSTLGRVERLEELIVDYGISQLFITQQNLPEGMKERLMRIAHRTQTQCSLVPDELSLDLATVKLSEIANIPVVHLSSHRLSGWGIILKTLFDKVLAILAFICLSPVLIIAWVFVKADLRRKGHPDASPVYISRRIGKEGKHFNCYKFRSMTPNTHHMFLSLHEQQKDEKEGHILQIQNDPRVTKIGHTLRQTSIDELPQLWNVIRGDMSIVGPRPHCIEEIELYYAKDEHRVFNVKPGITSYSQIHGRSYVSLRDELRYEIYYIQNWSLWLDIIIIWQTLIMVIQRKNVV